MFFTDSSRYRRSQDAELTITDPYHPSYEYFHCLHQSNVITKRPKTIFPVPFDDLIQRIYTATFGRTIDDAYWRRYTHRSALYMRQELQRFLF